MYDKKSSFNIKEIKTFMPGGSSDFSRVYFYEDGTILTIGNDEEGYTFSVYTEAGEEKSVFIDYSYGQLSDVKIINNQAWLCFYDQIMQYDEEYNILKLTEDKYEHIVSFKRESYLHDMLYCRIFFKDGGVHANIIKHNRVHQYFLEDEAIVETDFMEGGKWYLCDKFSICYMGGTVEIYNEFFELIGTFEYDFDIDIVCWAVSDSGEVLAAAFTDITNEQSLVFSVNVSSRTVDTAYIEHPTADIGFSGHRIIVNPYSFNSDFGGFIAFDRHMRQIYAHMRMINSAGPALGTYSPAFHRSYGIYQAPGASVVMEQNQLVIMDNNFRTVQEISIPNTDCAAVSKDGKIAVLRINRKDYSSESSVCHKDVKLDVYQRNDSTSGKVIEMMDFSR